MGKLIFAAILALAAAGQARSEVRVHVNVGFPYGYAPRDVVYVERYVPEYDVPRVLVVARHARVAPAVVVGYYRQGWGWDRMCDRFRVPRRAIYGSAYYDDFRHYKKWRHKGRRHHDDDYWDDDRGRRRGRR